MTGMFTAPHAIPGAPAAKAGPPPAAGESTASPPPLVVAVTALPSIDHTGVIQAARALGRVDRRFSRAVEAALHWYNEARSLAGVYHATLENAQWKQDEAALEAAHQALREREMRIQQLDSENRRLLAEINDDETARQGLAEVRRALDGYGYDHGQLVARIHAMGSDLDQARARSVTPPSPQPNDDLTLAYLRQWWQRLPANQRTADALAAVLDDLARPWHRRGTAWTGVLRACEGAIIGQTPAQMSRVNSSEKVTVKLGG